MQGVDTVGKTNEREKYMENILPEEHNRKMQELVQIFDEAQSIAVAQGYYGKSNEGHIQLVLDYGNAIGRSESETDRVLEPELRVEIWSYIFCEGGNSVEFANIDDALEAVKSFRNSAHNM